MKRSWTLPFKFRNKTKERIESMREGLHEQLDKFIDEAKESAKE